MTNNVAISAVPKKKRRKIASLDRRKARAGWFFVLPFILGFALIYIPMFFDSIVMSFQNIEMNEAGFTRTFAQFEHYRYALMVDPDFVPTLISGFKQLAFDIPAILIFSLFMAVMLNQKMAGRGFFRAIFFLPVILSTGIMESIAAADTLNAAMSAGIDDGSGTNTTTQIVSSMDLERLFSSMKVGTEIVEYVTAAINNIYDIVNRSGVQMLIFLAALQSISPAIYESCKIDGATSWETFWKITFPMISPMILVNGIYTIIDSFTTKSNKVMTYIAGVYSQPGGGSERSSAMSWMYFLLVIVIVAVIAAIFSAFVFYGRKND